MCAGFMLPAAAAGLLAWLLRLVHCMPLDVRRLGSSAGDITACFMCPPPLLQVDPQVSASVYYAASLYYKQQKEYAQYYRWGCPGQG